MRWDEMEEIDWWVSRGTKPITNCAAIWRVKLFNGGAGSSSLQSIIPFHQQRKVNFSSFDFISFFDWKEKNELNEKEDIITVFTVSTETSIKLGE